MFEEQVDKFIETEVKFKARIGPFQEPPIKGMHISPMLTRPKSDSSEHRVIVDLSFPSAFSVNNAIKKMCI